MARVAMYLQDKHAIREGMAYMQYAEQRGHWYNRVTNEARLYQWPRSLQ